MAASRTGYTLSTPAAGPRFPRIAALDPLTRAEVEGAEAIAQDVCTGLAFIGTLLARLAAAIRGAGVAPRGAGALRHN